MPIVVGVEIVGAVRAEPGPAVEAAVPVVLMGPSAGGGRACG